MAKEDPSDLLDGEETRVWGDSAYQGQSEVIRAHAPKAKDFTHRRYRYKDSVEPSTTSAT